MNMKITKTGAAALAVCLLLSACSAGVGKDELHSSASPLTSTQSAKSKSADAVKPQTQNNKKWIVSDIAGSVTADMVLSQKDDYHAAMNQEWMSTAKMPAGKVTMRGSDIIDAEVKSQIQTLLSDSSQTSHEAKLVQKFYKDFVDMEARNKLGLTPIIPQIQAIQEISSIAELTEYYTSNSQKKLSTPPIRFVLSTDGDDSQRMITTIIPPDCSLGDADEYKKLSSTGALKKQATELVFTTMLQRLGYSQQKAEDTTALFFEMEGKIYAKAAGISEKVKPEFSINANNPASLADLKKSSPVFPIELFLKPFSDLGIDNFINTEPNWLSGMNALYTQENLDGFKAILLYQVINESLLHLDQEAFDLEEQRRSVMAGTEIKLLPENVVRQYLDNYFFMAVGKMYAEKHGSAETKEDITKMAQDITNVYRKRLSEADWLSENTRKNAIEKLDAIKFQIAYPDDWTPYEYPELIFAEKNNAVDNYTDTRAYVAQFIRRSAAGTLKIRDWSMGPHEIGAAYSPTKNAITITSAIAMGDYYSKDHSLEQNLGGMGTIIAHEISHAFDSNGSEYDLNGNEKNWWTKEDRVAFDARTKKVSEYFSNFEVFPGVFVNGDMTLGETIADLGSVACVLDMAKDIEDFDYNAFFESYSVSSKRQVLSNHLEQDIPTNPHPPTYLRINAVLQQYQEFYDTIGIKEGDGMYLAPEKRLLVW